MFAERLRPTVKKMVTPDLALPYILKHFAVWGFDVKIKYVQCNALNSSFW